MLCLKVSRKGQESCVVGAENARNIQVSVHATPGASQRAQILAYSEVKETPEFTVALRWLEDAPMLELGESVTIEVIESDRPALGHELNKRGRRNTGEKVELYCSWCGKNAEDVVKLIAGPNVFICNECVGLCNEILTDGIGES